MQIGYAKGLLGIGGKAGKFPHVNTVIRGGGVMLAVEKDAIYLYIYERRDCVSVSQSYLTLSPATSAPAATDVPAHIQKAHSYPSVYLSPTCTTGTVPTPRTKLAKADPRATRENTFPPIAVPNMLPHSMAMGVNMLPWPKKVSSTQVR